MKNSGKENTDYIIKNIKPGNAQKREAWRVVQSTIQLLLLLLFQMNCDRNCN